MVSVSEFKQELNPVESNVGEIEKRLVEFENSFFTVDVVGKKALVNRVIDACSDWIDALPETDPMSGKDPFAVDVNAKYILDFQKKMVNLLYLPFLENFEYNDKKTFQENFQRYLAKSRIMLLKGVLPSEKTLRMIYLDSPEYGAEYRYNGSDIRFWFGDNRLLSYRKYVELNGTNMFFNQSEIDSRKLQIGKDGLLLIKSESGGSFVPYETHDNELIGMKGHYIFVIDREGNLLGLRDEDLSRYPTIHHSSFASGTPVIFAGTIRVYKGKILELAAESGHYKSTMINMFNALEILKSKGVNVYDIRIYSGSTNQEYDVEKIMQTKGFCLPKDISGYFYNTFKISIFSLDSVKQEAYLLDKLMYLETAAHLKSPEAALIYISHILSKYFVPRDWFNDAGDYCILSEEEQSEAYTLQLCRLFNFVKSLSDPISKDFVKYLIGEIDVARSSNNYLKLNKTHSDMSLDILKDNIYLDMLLLMLCRYVNKQYSFNLDSAVKLYKEMLTMEGIDSLTSEDIKQNIIFLFKNLKPSDQLSFQQTIDFSLVKTSNNLNEMDKDEICSALGNAPKMVQASSGASSSKTSDKILRFQPNTAEQGEKQEQDDTHESRKNVKDLIKRFDKGSAPKKR